MSLAANALTIQQTQGWFESGCVKWSPVSGANNYEVYYAPAGSISWTKLDDELVRQYPDYYRADAVGLKAGSYKFRVDAMAGTSVLDSQETEAFTATAYDRSGFAHVGMSEGIGAYKNDGTLKDGAEVLYVWADNAKTVTCQMQYSNTAKQTYTGLQTIIAVLEKNVSNRIPMAIRIIGTIKDTDMDKLLSSEEGLQVKGSNGNKSNITIEGIGDDAAIHGFGILSRGIVSAEFRNFAIMLCMDDCLSIDTDNKHIWIHNMDFFYGSTGSDADQAKGDGTVDIKGKSSHVTVSYNHFYDAGKCSLGGMKSETTDCWMSYHHNWFDHSDSRHPRIRTAFYHVYNNYFDGNAKYGTGVAMGGSAFVEKNYFRNCKYPMLSSLQGTDAEGDGTFSGENGGVIKAFDNVIINPQQIRYNTGAMTDGKWDAVLVENRSATVSAICFTGSTGYNNDADLAARTTYFEKTIDEPADVPAIVTGQLGAGRMNHGDFTWKFKNSTQDQNYGVIDGLKKALGTYQSTLVGFANGKPISNGGATQPYVGGDGVGISDEDNNSYKPSWGTGKIYVDGELQNGGEGNPEDGSDTPPGSSPYIVGSNGDYYWFNSYNKSEVDGWIKDRTITLANSANGEGKTSYNPEYSNSNSDPKLCTQVSGSIQLGKSTAGGTYDGGSITFYCPEGVNIFKVYSFRTGSNYYCVQTSTDGNSFTTKQTVNKAASGINETDFSANVECADPIWIRILNGSSGGLNIQGVKIYKPDTSTPDDGNDDADLESSDLTALKETIELDLFGTYTLTADVDYSTSSTGTISYRSSKTSVATVDSNGLITAKGAGTATITLSQAKDETYDGGNIQFVITVTDRRVASTLELKSDANVTLKLKDVETSQIDVEGAAGAVTYKSDKTSVVTVSTTGLITAVAAGTAVITITDAGSTTTLPGSLTVNVTVEPADNQGDEETEQGTPVTWDLANATIVANETNEILSTDGTLTLIYVGGSSDAIKNNQFQPNGKTQTSNNLYTSRYFILPPLSGSGTLSIEYGTTEGNVVVRKSASSKGELVGTITPTDSSIRLENLNNTVYYLGMEEVKVYFKSITWTPDAAATIEGDVDADGDVDDDDVTMLEQILLEQKDATSGADVDNDGNVSIADMTRLIEILKEKK